jgi:mxaJ protein
VCARIPTISTFSNKALEGFENKPAELVAKDLGRAVTDTWHAQPRGFIRETLAAGACDVVMGMPSDFEMAMSTRAYYRSSYVFVTRRGGGTPIRSFDDPRLRQLRIGVHVIGDDYASAVLRRAIDDAAGGHAGG